MHVKLRERKCKMSVLCKDKTSYVISIRTRDSTFKVTLFKCVSFGKSALLCRRVGVFASLLIVTLLYLRGIRKSKNKCYKTMSRLSDGLSGVRRIFSVGVRLH